MKVKKFIDLLKSSMSRDHWGDDPKEILRKAYFPSDFLKT
jgi:hypothetical protein